MDGGVDGGPILKKGLHSSYRQRALFKYGQVSPELQKLVPVELLLFDASEFPVTDRFYADEYQRKFLFGEIRADTFWAELARGAFDPVNFIGIYFDQFDDNQTFTGVLRKYSPRPISG